MSRHSQAVAEELRRTRSYAKKVKAKNKQKVKEARKLRAKLMLSDCRSDTKVSTTNGKLKELVRLQGHIEKRASESKVSYEQRIAEYSPVATLTIEPFGSVWRGAYCMLLLVVAAARLLLWLVSLLYQSAAVAAPSEWSYSIVVMCSFLFSGYNAFVDMPAPASLFRHTTVESARRHRRVRDRKTRQHVDAAAGLLHWTATLYVSFCAGPSTIAEESKENQATTQPSQEEDDVDLAESHLWPAEHANQ